MSARLKTACRGRKRKACMSARKSCKYASGTKRRFCRKRRSTRKNMK